MLVFKPAMHKKVYASCDRSFPLCQWQEASVSFPELILDEWVSERASVCGGLSLPQSKPHTDGMAGETNSTRTEFGAHCELRALIDCFLHRQDDWRRGIGGQRKSGQVNEKTKTNLIYKKKEDDSDGRQGRTDYEGDFTKSPTEFTQREEEKLRGSSLVGEMETEKQTKTKYEWKINQ